MLTFTILLGFAVLVAAAINEAKHSGSTMAKIMAGVLIILFLFFLMAL